MSGELPPAGRRARLPSLFRDAALGAAVLGAVAAGAAAEGGTTGEARALVADVPTVLLPRAVLPQLAAGESPVAVELEAARARWAAAGPTHYRVGVQHAVFGTIVQATVEVNGRSAVVVAAACEGWSTTCPALDAARYTVAGLFRAIDEALGAQLATPPGAQGSLRVAATFDPVDGHPLTLDTDVLLVTDTMVHWQVEWLEAVHE